MTDDCLPVKAASPYAKKGSLWAWVRQRASAFRFPLWIKPRPKSTSTLWVRYVPNPALPFFILLLGKDTQTLQLTGNGAYKHLHSQQPRCLCSWTGKLRERARSFRLSPSSVGIDALSLRHIQTKLSTVFVKACQAVGSLNFQTTEQGLLNFWDGCEESAPRSQPLGNWQALLAKWWCSQEWQTVAPGGHAPSKTPRACDMFQKSVSFLVNWKPQSVMRSSPYMLLPTKYRLSYALSLCTFLRASLSTLNMLFTPRTRLELMFPRHKD